MLSWCGYGNSDRRSFDNDMEPERMEFVLRKYQEELGDEFTVDHLMKLFEIKASVMLAAAITDFPEYLLHQVGIYENSHEVPGIGRSLSDLVDMLQQEIDKRD